MLSLARKARQVAAAIYLLLSDAAMTSQVGQFFMLVGGIALVIFLATARVETPDLRVCLGGLVLFALGSYLFWRGYRPPPPSGRFSGWKNRNKKKS